MNKQLVISYVEYQSDRDLEPADRELLERARLATKGAYAPYSQFYVGAAARLDSGKISVGTNQENASYPVCMCAEQTLVLGLVNELKQYKIEAIAVSYNTSNSVADTPASPCGKCRQFLSEFESRQGQSIRIIMSGMTGMVRVLESVSSLLPLAFNSKFLLDE